MKTIKLSNIKKIKTIVEVASTYSRLIMAIAPFPYSRDDITKCGWLSSH